MRISLAILMALTLAVGANPASAQDPMAERQAALDAYIRVLSTHFGLPPTEVRILAQGRTAPDELAVALRLARLSGIAPVSLLAQRRSGEGWSQIHARSGLGAATYYVAIPDNEVDSRVARVHGLFRDSPPTGWDAIQLTDEEFITLANLILLNAELGARHGDILAARAAAGSFVDAIGRLPGAR